jgi:hypothetical protein
MNRSSPAPGLSKALRDLRRKVSAKGRRRSEREARKRRRREEEFQKHLLSCLD